jgi:uncharacterized membrane protein
MWWDMPQPDTITLIIGIGFIVLTAGVVMMFMFPRLHSISSTESIKEQVESKKADIEGEEETEKEGMGRAVEVAMRLLEPDEKRVVKTIVEAGGTILQKEISHELGFSRVKTHRVLLRLIRRGVVTAEKYYNTNRIELADWLK